MRFLLSLYFVFLCSLYFLSSSPFSFASRSFSDSDRITISSSGRYGQRGERWMAREIESIPFTRVPSFAPPPFGHPMLQYFKLAKGYRNFNAGSFGGPPIPVIEQQRAFVDLMESKPDPFFRGGYQSVTRANRATIAQYVNANVSDIVLVENTSSGINAIMKSFLWQDGDSVLILDTAYDMVQHTLQYIGGRYNVSIHKTTIVYPIQDVETSYLEPVRAMLASMPAPPRMCVFSHISCEPAIIVPIETLTSICQSVGAITVIDGAHAVGQIDVDLSALQSLGVDYYAANGQKWLYGSKGTAFLWVAPVHNQQQIIKPAISDSLEQYIPEFEYVGTRAYDAWCSLNATFVWRAWLGDENIKNYIKTLAVKGAQYLIGLWGTEIGAPFELQHAMMNIRLPTNNRTLVWQLTHSVAARFNTEVVVFERPTGIFWTRVSTQIYHEMSDYEFMGNAILQYFNLTAASGPGTRLHELNPYPKRFARS